MGCGTGFPGGKTAAVVWIVGGGRRWGFLLVFWKVPFFKKPFEVGICPRRISALLRAVVHVVPVGGGAGRDCIRLAGQLASYLGSNPLGSCILT